MTNPYLSVFGIATASAGAAGMIGAIVKNSAPVIGAIITPIIKPHAEKFLTDLQALGLNMVAQAMAEESNQSKPENTQK